MEHEAYTPDGTELRGTLPRRYAAQFERYAVGPLAPLAEPAPAAAR